MQNTNKSPFQQNRQSDSVAGPGSANTRFLLLCHLVKTVRNHVAASGAGHEGTGLMDGDAVLGPHFVKLVDADNTVVRQHHRAPLQVHSKSFLQTPNTPILISDVYSIQALRVHPVMLILC